MASTSSRRVGSHRTHERPSSKSDDPWCLICGVNLALDGRTFTVVSPHQNSELCDVFLRVLAMTFTQENAFVNVCNRCERQLKRLGRTTSIAMARQEGRKFREQVEGNVAKHGLQGVALGDFRNLNMTAAAVSSKTDNSASSGGTMRRGNTVDESSSARKGREMYSRSNSSVRVEDKESGKRGAYNRDLSAPERKVQARELHSTVNESSDKNKEVRRGTRPGNQTAAVERTASFKAISDDKRSKSSIPSQRRVPPTRDGKPSIQKMNSVDLPQKSGKVSTTTFAREASKTEPSKSQAERKQHPGKPDNNKQEHRENNIHNDSWELSSGELNPFAADIELESSNVEAGRAFDDHARRQIQHAFHEYQARDVTVLTDDDQFIQTERAVLMESSQSSHSSNEAVDDDEKPRADAHGSSPKFCVGTDGQTLPIGDEHERAAEQLTAEEENRDRARRLRVTFSENVGDDVNDETLVREHSGSSQARQDSASVKTASDKGKLSKYESIDLDIDNSNPFFDDVLGEYNRRVAINQKVLSLGVSQANRKGFQAIEPILESDDPEATQGLQDEGADIHILQNGTQPGSGSVTDSKQWKHFRNGHSMRGHLGEQGTGQDGDKVEKYPMPGDVFVLALQHAR
ncbi:hypothetical protein BsWGS_11733 [Bradybaena similaris]